MVSHGWKARAKNTTYPFAIDIFALVAGALQVDAVEAAHSDAKDELEEVQYGEGQVAQRHAEDLHCCEGHSVGSATVKVVSGSGVGVVCVGVVKTEGSKEVVDVMCVAGGALAGSA